MNERMGRRRLRTLQRLDGEEVGALERCNIWLLGTPARLPGRRTIAGSDARSCTRGEINKAESRSRSDQLADGGRGAVGALIQARSDGEGRGEGLQLEPVNCKEEKKKFYEFLGLQLENSIGEPD